MADRLDVPANKGVIVQDVKSGSFAEDVGLTRGDVILEINKQTVNSEDEFNRVSGRAEERSGRGFPRPSTRRWPSGWNHLPGRNTSVTCDNLWVTKVAAPASRRQSWRASRPPIGRPEAGYTGLPQRG